VTTKCILIFGRCLYFTHLPEAARPRGRICTKFGTAVACRDHQVNHQGQFFGNRLRGIDSIRGGVEICQFPQTSPVAVNTGLALYREARGPYAFISLLVTSFSNGSEFKGCCADFLKVGPIGLYSDHFTVGMDNRLMLMYTYNFLGILYRKLSLLQQALLSSLTATAKGSMSLLPQCHLLETLRKRPHCPIRLFPVGYKPTFTMGRDLSCQK